MPSYRCAQAAVDAERGYESPTRRRCRFRTEADDPVAGPVVRTACIDEKKRARWRRTPRERRNHVQRGLQLGFQRFIHAIGPKIVRIFTIGDISSTWPSRNSLERTFYAGLRIALGYAIRIHAGMEGGTDEYLGKLGKRCRDTCARP
jgi:hypothetical protein